MCDAVVDNRRRWQHLLMTTQSQTDHQQQDTAAAAAAAAVMRSLYPHTHICISSVNPNCPDVARHHRRWNTGLTAGLDCTPHARLPLCTLSTVPRAIRSHWQDVGYSVTTWRARHHHQHRHHQQQQQQLGISRYQRLHHHLYLQPHSLTLSAAVVRLLEKN